MPLFDFVCKNCEITESDVILKLNADASQFPKCSKCGDVMEKQVGVPGRAQFKGSGFHCTTYRAPTRGF